MSDEYSTGSLGGDGRWMRHHLDAEGTAPDLQAVLIEMHAGAAARPAGGDRPPRRRREDPGCGALPCASSTAACRWPSSTDPRYDDWSWAKGKLDPGEDWAGRRRARDRGGDRAGVRLGATAARPRYTLLGRDGTPDDKVVRYWSAGSRRRRARSSRDRRGRLARRRRAHARLDYARDHDQLRALVTPAADRAARHLAARARAARHAVARGDWRQPDDTARPLDPLGRERAEAWPVLTAYGGTRSSPRPPCAASIRSAVCRRGRERLRTRRGCPRRASGGNPKGAPAPRHGCWSGASRRCCAPTGRCCPVARTRAGSTSTPPARSRWPRCSRPARDEKLVKGEALVCHVAGPRGRAGRRGGAPRRLSGPLRRRAPGSLSRTPFRPDRPDDECADAVHGPLTRCEPSRHPASIPSLCRAVSPASLTLVLGEVTHSEDPASRPGRRPSPWSARSPWRAAAPTTTPDSGAELAPAPAPRHQPTAPRAR